MNDRLNALRKKMKEIGVDSFLITKLHNVRWFTGYTGTNGLCVVFRRDAYFLTDFRYTGQAKKETRGSGFKLLFAKRDLITSLGEIRKAVFGDRVGFEADDLTFQFHQRIKKILKGKKLVAAGGVIANLRIIKDKSEIRNLKKAVRITDEVFTEILPRIKPGISEIELMSELEFLCHKKNAYASFETIVASGYRSALPHGRASKKKIKKGEFITFDFGVVYNGYTSDMTRTIVLGKATDKQKKIYDLVLQAQLSAIKAIKAGVKASDVDAVARNVITDEGYGQFFGHALGHGIGICVQGDRINIHEGPILAARSKDILEENMVVTVEPGVYLPGWGGVRIEDDVIVTRKGCIIMNKSPKKLLEL